MPDPVSEQVEKVTLWRCPDHGLIQANVIVAEDEELDGECPVPCYDEEPCCKPLEEPVTAFIPSDGIHLVGLTEEEIEASADLIEAHAYSPATLEPAAKLRTALEEGGRDA